MKIDALYNVVSNADKLSEFSVGELRQMVRQFPYFQMARKILLRKLHEEDLENFEDELRCSSVYIGDRAKLYFYINTNSLHSQQLTGQSLPDLSLITTQHESVRDNMSVSGHSSDSTVNYLFLSEDEANEINREVDKKEDMDRGDMETGVGIDLIDKFMNSGGGKIKPSKEEGGAIVNLAEESVKENPAILTETLARIYIKQKKYDKAIDIFNNLSLKFPEKSSYFADRIKELDILIKSS